MINLIVFIFGNDVYVVGLVFMDDCRYFGIV